MSISDAPEHMREEAEYFGHFSPDFYFESTCQHCGQPVYKYQLDLIIEWKHFNHDVYCYRSPRAKPVEDKP